jgi:hypothetical protein
VGPGAAIQNRRHHSRRMSGQDRRSSPPRAELRSLSGRRRDHHDTPAAAARTAFKRQSEIPSYGWSRSRSRRQPRARQSIYRRR